MKRIKRILKVLGPGFVTGASDDDPSGIATYAQTGAMFGYNQLWTALFTFPLMVVVQEMCGRIGLVTGRGLAGVMRRHYSRPFLFGGVSLLLIANTINIGADLGAMAAAGQMIFGIPFILWLVAITAITILLEVFVSYHIYSRILKYLTLSLLSYVVVVFIIKQDWGHIAISTFVPYVTLSREYIFNLLAILGTTISPYLFFWQADEEVEEEIEHHKIKGIGLGTPRIARKDITGMRIDTMAGMFFSNLIMFFIIVTMASTLHVQNITDIQTADQAAQALRPLAGNFASLLFAIGIIGTGFLAVPILAGSASYAISEGMRWNAGLSKKFNQARGFYAIIILSTLVGVLINFIGIKPFQMLYYTAVINGICAPLLLVFILLIANNKKIMQERTNGTTQNVLGIMTIAIMTITAVALFLSIV